MFDKVLTEAQIKFISDLIPEMEKSLIKTKLKERHSAIVIQILDSYPNLSVRDLPEIGDGKAVANIIGQHDILDENQIDLLCKRFNLSKDLF